MLIHAEIDTSPAYALRLTSEVTPTGEEQFHLRVYARKNEGGALSPTQTAVYFRTSQIPALREALERAEQRALRAGLLTHADYIEAGVEAPTGLRARATAG